MEKLEFSSEISKKEVFSKIEKKLGNLSLTITQIDNSRPWGGFFRIDESQAAQFAAEFFPCQTIEELTKHGDNLSPKILLVEPGKRLSWQYHDRRAEYWRIISGPVGVAVSKDDNQPKPKTISSNQTVEFGTQVRHRLIGLTSWGVVAEVWQHVDSENLSDESDITRVEDDFGR